jgi:polar amino acid transport system substrate-binding protein
MGRDFPPFYYRNENNELEGFEVDVAREVAKRLGVRLKLVNIEWSGILDGLLAEMYDGVLSSMAVTEERKKIVAFSRPYYFSGSQVFVATDSDFKQTEALSGKRIGVAGGTTYETDAADTLGAKIRYYRHAGEALNALNRHEIDGVITDRVVGLYLMNSHRLDIRPLGAPLRNEEIAIAFRKGDRSLRGAVNRIIEDMGQDDTLNRLIRKVAGQQYELK